MLPTWYNEYKNFIDNSIKIFLENYLNENLSKPLNDFKEIVFYATNSGKRIRSILALETYLSLTNKTIKDIKLDDDILKICIALELVHAYSLIHDDLPCMDNDEYRRGQLTVWKKFGEANAVLAGDLLNTLTFEVLSDIGNSEKSKKIINLLSRSVGFYGMLGGQVEDLYFEKKFSELDIRKLENLHNKKTGKLIEASILSGLILAEQNSHTHEFEKSENYKKLSSFGQNIGLAFQIKDDLLDVEGTFESTGKSVGGEEKGFVYFIGIDEAKSYLGKLTKKSFEDINHLKSEKLNFLTNYIAERKK
ncbi:MAG: polyprenyl synthetase family protein [Candidatus Gracilibacteria bacterium]|nr:polyprenyl synthetase family protein [Candidatus Gracilibacteria bacterium]